MSPRPRNIREIATAAGVSVATVSRTLKGGEEAAKVSSKLRQRVLAVCEKHRYYPNLHTVSMMSGRSNAVGFLAPPDMLYTASAAPSVDLNATAALGGAAQALAEEGMYLTLAPVTKRFVEAREFLRLLRGKLVDGLLVWGWMAEDEYVQELIAEKAPVVMIQCASPDLPLDQVVARDREGMRLIVDHLVELGHRQIGFVPPHVQASAGLARHEGVMEALAAHGLQPTGISDAHGFSTDVGEAGGRELLARHPEITAIIAANDQSAVGVMRAAVAAGRRVPEDLSVTGADGLSPTMPQMLTTFTTPAYEIGRAGVQLLLERIAEPRRELQRLALPVSLRVGHTSAPPASRGGN